MRYRLPYAAYLLMILSPAVLAQNTSAGYTTFNPQFLHRIEGQDNIDVSHFDRPNTPQPGIYAADLYVNNNYRARFDARFVADKSNSEQVNFCVDRNFIQTAGIDTGKLSSASLTLLNQSECAPIEKILPQAKLSFTVSTLRLNLNIPQALLNHEPRGYVNPVLWQNGITSAFVDYHINTYHTQSGDNTQNTAFLNLRSGINLGSWHLRHNGTYSRQSAQDKGYTAINTYLRHDIPTLRSTLTLGDFYSSTDTRNGINMRGIKIASDDRMLPPSHVGYAPIIHGIADSLSLVKVFYQNNEIYRTTVPAGAFTIDDLYPLGQGGDLTVEVTGADGRTQQYTVAANLSRQMLRPHQHYFEVALGYPRDQSHLVREKTAQALWRYGINNYLTARSAATWSPNYHALSLGAALGTPIGVLTLDGTTQRSQPDRQQPMQNARYYSLQYQHYLPRSATNIFAQAEYYSPYARTFSSFIQAIDTSDVVTESDLTQIKNRIQLSVNQSLGERRGNFFLNGSREIHRDNARFTQYQIGYGNSFKSVNYSITYQKNQNSLPNGKSNQQLVLTFSIPLERQHNTYLNTILTHATDSSSIQSGISGSLGTDNALAYNLTASHYQNAGGGYSLNSTYHTRVADFSAAYNHAQGLRQSSFELNGALVAHPGGITLSNQLGDTFAIVYAKDGSGAKINGTNYGCLDWRGWGIVPYLVPYRINTVGIDPTGLPLDVSFDSTSKDIVPRADAAMMLRFHSESGPSALFEITLSDGKRAPLGASILDENGNNIGFVAQNGRAFLRNLNKDGKLTVQWSRIGNRSCWFNYHLSEEAKQIKLPKTIPVMCTLHQEKE